MFENAWYRPAVCSADSASLWRTVSGTGRSEVGVFLQSGYDEGLCCY